MSKAKVQFLMSFLVVFICCGNADDQQLAAWFEGRDEKPLSDKTINENVMCDGKDQHGWVQVTASFDRSHVKGKTLFTVILRALSGKIEADGSGSGGYEWTFPDQSSAVFHGSSRYVSNLYHEFVLQTKPWSQSTYWGEATIRLWDQLGKKAREVSLTCQIRDYNQMDNSKVEQLILDSINQWIAAERGKRGWSSEVKVKKVSLYPRAIPTYTNPAEVTVTIDFPGRDEIEYGSTWFGQIFLHKDNNDGVIRADGFSLKYLGWSEREEKITRFLNGFAAR